jgi:hypothetical protein
MNDVERYVSSSSKSNACLRLRGGFLRTLLGTVLPTSTAEAGDASTSSKSLNMTRTRLPRSRAAAIGVVAVVVAAAIAVLLGGGPAFAGDAAAACPHQTATSIWNANNPWCFDWQGDWEHRAVQVPLPSGAGTIAGTEFVPVSLASGARLPAVAVLHGLGGKEQNMWWLGRYLAGHGYVALTVTTAGNSAANFTDAMQGMVDFLRSPANPYAGNIDTQRLGATGHSAGARAASWIQDADWSAHPADHVRAVVALDNLTSDQQGDSGTYLLAPQCTTGLYTSGINSLPITPRVAALGLASDDNAVTCPERNVLADHDAKKAAWSKWMSAGVPSIELVLKGSNHFSFDQDIGRMATTDSYLHLIAQSTEAWFDRYLNGRRSGVERLLEADLFGAPRDSQLSNAFRSAAYVPDIGKVCSDFTTAQCPPLLRPAIDRISPSSGEIGDPVRLSARLTTDTGTPVQDAALTFDVRGQTVTASTGSDGVATVDSQPLGGPAGDAELTVAFSGDATFVSTSAAVPFHIDRDGTRLTIAIRGTRSRPIIAASLVDADTGDGLAARTVSFAINGQDMGAATTDQNGLATKQLDRALKKGDRVVASFAGDDAYQPISSSP